MGAWLRLHLKCKDISQKIIAQINRCRAEVLLLRMVKYVLQMVKEPGEQKPGRFRGEPSELRPFK